jgi:hypothetical protein
MGHQPQLIGGGLVRSLGGWSQVQSAQRKGQKTEYDERILGSGDFVTAIFKEAEEKQIRQLKLRRSGRTIARYYQGGMQAKQGQYRRADKGKQAFQSE